MYYSRIFITCRLTHELCNPLDEWLDWLIPVSHSTDYIIHRLTPGVKSLVNKGLRKEISNPVNSINKKFCHFNLVDVLKKKFRKIPLSFNQLNLKISAMVKWIYSKNGRCEVSNSTPNSVFTKENQNIKGFSPNNQF